MRLLDSDDYKGDQLSLQLGPEMSSKCPFISHTLFLEMLCPTFIPDFGVDLIKRQVAL